MFEQTFKNIDDVLFKDAGCSSALDYVEQTSWILFLKYLSDLEAEKRSIAGFKGKKYQYIIDEKFRWDVWAAPKTEDNKIDQNKILSGDDLKLFVDFQLFPYLMKFKNSALSSDTIEYKIGEIFSEIRNKIQSGYILRDVINFIDKLSFQTHEQKHELSSLYEEKIKNMGAAGKNGGEYYTPRPLIKTIVKLIDPEVNETIYDGAVGSAGFLCEAFEYLKEKYSNRTTVIEETFQKRTFYGKEKKPLPYILGTMNMILHGIDAPNLLHTNTLAENIAHFQEKDRYNIVIANPPFGAKERKEVQENFPIKSGETAYLFLQHFIKILKAGGRAGIIIKNTFLSNTDNASINLRKHLLESCSLHSILDVPSGAFKAGVHTVVLFFEKGNRTDRIWYYQLNLKRNLGKTNPLSEEDLGEFVKLYKNKEDSINSWSVNVKDIEGTYNLSVKNPNKKNEVSLRDPREIIEEIKSLDAESEELLDQIMELI